jgi:FMN-dependent NADH-azoreductase
MTNILAISTSPRGAQSYSNRVADRVLEELRSTHPDARITMRDLASHPLPHIDQDFVAATRSPDGAQSNAQKAILVTSDALVDELLRADIVVIAAGMINFTIPSTLKTWIDYVARAGRTFSYSEAGPKGLATGKHVILVAATGGVYSDKRALDFQVPYLKHVLGFLGMTDIEVVDVEGTGYGPEAAEKAVATASRKVKERCAEAAAAA